MLGTQTNLNIKFYFKNQLKILTFVILKVHRHVKIITCFNNLIRRKKTFETL